MAERMAGISSNKRDKFHLRAQHFHLPKRTTEPYALSSHSTQLLHLQLP